MLCPLYMAEISPPEFRGALMAMEQFSIVLGCVLGFWAGFFTRGGMSIPFPLYGTAGLHVYDDLFDILKLHPIRNQRALGDDDPARQPIGLLDPRFVLNTSPSPRGLLRRLPVRVSCFYFFFFPSPAGSRRIRFMEDSARVSIDPGDHARDRMHFFTSFSEAPRCTGAQ